MLNYVLTNSKKRDNMETTGNDFLERIKKIQTPVNDALEKYFNGSLDNSGLKLSENEVKKTQQMLNDGGFTDWKGKKLAVDGVRGKRFEDSFNKYMQSTVYDPKVETLQRALNVNGFRDKNGNQLLTDGKYGPKTDSAVMAAAEEYRNMNNSASEKSADMPDTIDDYIKNDNKSKTIGYLENIRQNSPESFDKIMNELEQNGIDINDIDSIVGSVTDNAKNADLDYDASLEDMLGGAETVATGYDNLLPDISKYDLDKLTENMVREKGYYVRSDVPVLQKIFVEYTKKNAQKLLDRNKMTNSTAKVISLNDRGLDVEAIQFRLNQLGYRDKNGNVLVQDGIFGENTLFAVKQFQKEMGLDVDGKVGKMTRAHLYIGNDIEVTQKIYKETLRVVQENMSGRNIEDKRVTLDKLLEFYYMVRKGSPIDLKSDPEWKYSSCFIFDNRVVRGDAPGNIAYGIAGRILNIDLGLLLDAAGAAQIKAKTSTERWRQYGNGDDPVDQINIQIGYFYADDMIK